jgi:magnesium transporter
MALAFFIPLLIGTAGNAGSQAATLMVRALATNEIELSEWWRALLKDVAVGLCLGVTMGLCGWLLGLLRGGPGIAIVVGLTMMAAVLVANLIGGSLPFVLTHFGLDPAAASGPLITSIMDTIGLLTYFSVAAWLLGLPISG